MNSDDVRDSQIKELRKDVRELKEKLDTFIETPLLKRVGFWIAGYRWRRFGRWYPASWNSDAAQYEKTGVGDAK